MKKNLKKSIFYFLLFGIAGSLGVVAFIFFNLKDLPSIEKLKNYHPPESTIVYDRNGLVVGRFFEEKRTVIAVNNLPKYVLDAFIAAEDADFYNHSGIDYFGFLRAVLLEIKYKFIGGRRVGGSTITQQTARCMLLSSKQSYGRKLQEIVLAKRIEKALNKEQILHLYLNQIYFGFGAYGIEEASNTYFNKPAAKLLLHEAAALASIPKSPNRINPFADKIRLKKRQDYVLSNMSKLGMISKEEEEKAKKAFIGKVSEGKSIANNAPYFLQEIKKDLDLKLNNKILEKMGLKIYSTLDLKYQDAAEKALKKGLLNLDKRLGYRGPLLRLDANQKKLLHEKLDKFRKDTFVSKDEKDKFWDLKELGKGFDPKEATNKIKVINFFSHANIGARVVKVEDAQGLFIADLGSGYVKIPLSHMPFSIRKTANGSSVPVKKVSDLVAAGDIVLLRLYKSENKLSGILEQEPELDGALVAIDVETGGVLAMVGGYDFNRSSFNRVVQAKRQPGSSIKPLIYGLAIDKELFTPASIIADVPKAFFDPGKEEFWTPRNHDGEYRGDITFDKCLRASVNTCTITILEKVSIDNFLSFAENVGLITKDTLYPRNLTIALGSAENYPMQVAEAYLIFPKKGIYSPSHMIKNIKTNDGEIKYAHEQQEKQVMRPESTFIITQILRGVISSAQREKYLSQVKADVVGKTGTNNNVRSASFTGYSPKILASVYVGHDDNRSIGSAEWGVTTAFPIWADFMNRLDIHTEALVFEEPAGISWAYVDQSTGKAFLDIPSENENVIREPFIANTLPKVDDVANRNNFKIEEAFAP